MSILLIFNIMLSCYWIKIMILNYKNTIAIVDKILNTIVLIMLLLLLYHNLLNFLTY